MKILYFCQEKCMENQKKNYNLLTVRKAFENVKKGEKFFMILFPSN